MQAMGKILLLMGLVLAVLGVLLMLSDKIPFLGRLPGDIHVERPGFQLHIPLTTSIVLSVIVSLILWLISYFRGGR